MKKKASAKIDVSERFHKIYTLKIYISILDMFRYKKIKNKNLSKQFLPVYNKLLKKYVASNGLIKTLKILKGISFLSFFNFRVSLFIALDLILIRIINIHNSSILKWVESRIQHLIYLQLRSFNSIYMNNTKYVRQA